MGVLLTSAIETLRAHETELRRRGVLHAAIFGSVARGSQHGDSDLDVLVELAPERPMGLFEYTRLKLDLADILGGSADIVNRETLKPLLRDQIRRDAVDAF
ncbi:MAG: nucleotidyltransferase family protein [Acidobacteria bacterium]|nr:nucleotidyltransferase family protein [Acidobacteriota bacterium]